MKFVMMALTLATLRGDALAAQPVPVQLVFDNGRVTVVAVDVPATLLLAEWTRVGRTQISGGEALASRRVTLNLSVVPESTALAAILGEQYGFVAAPKADLASSVSWLARIHIERSRGAAAASTAALGPEPPEVKNSYYVPEAAQGGAGVPARPSPIVRPDAPAPETVFEYYKSDDNDPNSAFAQSLGRPHYPKFVTTPIAPEVRFEYYVPPKSKPPGSE